MPIHNRGNVQVKTPGTEHPWYWVLDMPPLQTQKTRKPSALYKEMDLCVTIS